MPTCVHRRITAKFVYGFCVLLFFSAQGHSQTGEEIARAYIQAITNGKGSTQAGAIDFGALGCNASTVFTKCAATVKDGKDGKTFFMEAIQETITNQTNFASVFSKDDLNRSYANLRDATFADTRTMLNRLAAYQSGLFPQYDGANKAKVRLQQYLDLTGNGGPAAVWLLSEKINEGAKIIEAGVKLRLDKLRPHPFSPIANFKYFWALQVNMTDMAYPANFSFLQDAGFDDPSKCANTTTSWGHIGLQYNIVNKYNAPAVRYINWGGGGDGSGKADYGCGGAYTPEITWKENVWYNVKVTRGKKISDKLWLWEGSIAEAGSGNSIFSKSIYGGEFIEAAGVWLEAIGVSCQDPRVESSWSDPYYVSGGQRYYVERLAIRYGNDGCMRTQQVLTNRCPLTIAQYQGNLREWNFDPKDRGRAPGHVKLNEMRSSDNDTFIRRGPCPPANLRIKP